MFTQLLKFFKRPTKNAPLKDIFISVSSHQILGPMTAMKGYLELIKSSPLPQVQEVHESIRLLSDNIDQLHDLVMNLLDVSRIENDTIVVDRKPVNLEILVKETLSKFAPIAQEKNLQLTYNLSLTQPLVYGDEWRLRQIITNLVSNALKYTPQGGLTISHEVTPKYISISFKDTGIGIDPQELNHLFQKWYRVRSKETESVRGNGLGLWIVKQFVEKMNGSVALESTKGSGTHVRVILPAVPTN